MSYVVVANKTRKKPATVAGEKVEKQQDPAAVETVAVACGADELDPALLCHALEATDGWKYEPYSYVGYSTGLLAGVETTRTPADDCLWFF